MPSFSIQSMARLETCDDRLIRLFQKVVIHYDCTIIQGSRDQLTQDEYFRTGKSKVQWPNSKHNVSGTQSVSLAVDVAPCPIDWEYIRAFDHFAGYVRGCAATIGVPIRWGGVWSGGFDLKNNRFNDLVHFELDVPNHY